MDASAILALLRKEEGSEFVAQMIGESIVSTVNFSEVVAKLVERLVPPDDAEDIVRLLPCLPVEFSLAHAAIAGKLRAQTRASGLSLGDRACLALAQHQGLAAITADRRWLDVGLDIDIRVIR